MQKITITLSCMMTAMLLGSATLNAQKAKKPTIVDDEQLRTELSDQLGDLADKKSMVFSDILVKQLKRKSVSLALPKANSKTLKDLYAARVSGIGIISSVYKCNRCPKWHSTGGATCWVLTEDGVMVTNYHVFDKKKKTKLAYGVMTQDGKVAAVTEILAADELQDIVIFKVAGKGYTPIPLGNAQKVGGGANIISHPDGRFFTYSGGHVSRYYWDRAMEDCYWMGVTAEYARGSSGGPVMDNEGNAIGMVSSTNSIYYPPRNPKDKKGPFQMVVHNCVPVDAIRELVKKPKTSSAK